MVCAAWQSGEGTARGVEGGWELQRDAWMPAQAGGGRAGPPRLRAAVHSGGGEQSRQAGSRWKNLDKFAISKNSRDPNVNQQ